MEGPETPASRLADKCRLYGSEVVRAGCVLQRCQAMSKCVADAQSKGQRRGQGRRQEMRHKE